MKKMKKKIPTFKTNAEAERFVATSDLTQFDLSGARAVQFEQKTTRLNVRLPAHLLKAVKRRAEQHGIPYTRFVREVLEKSLQGDGPEARDAAAVTHGKWGMPAILSAGRGRLAWNRQSLMDNSGWQG